jgi:hypothetical protein
VGVEAMAGPAAAAAARQGGTRAAGIRCIEASRAWSEREGCA